MILGYKNPLPVLYGPNVSHFKNPILSVFDNLLGEYIKLQLQPKIIFNSAGDISELTSPILKKQRWSGYSSPREG